MVRYCESTDVSESDYSDAPESDYSVYTEIDSLESEDDEDETKVKRLLNSL